ncbi:GntR family transcriptional regulator [Bradyrhizobium canariense]|nr:GntR family transcriptional regulator [Bradyrhizobium canariense]
MRHEVENALTGDSVGERERLQSSQLPLYVTLARLLTSDIEAGRWAAGEQLPTIAALAETYGVARVTIRQALGVLSDEGLIKTIQGKGSFVAERPPSELIHLESSWRHLLRTLDGNVADLIEVRDNVALPRSAQEAGTPKERYRYMRRIHRRRAAAYCVMELYLDSDLYAREPERFDGEMVIPLLSRLAGPTLKRMTQSFRIGAANLAIAKLLGIPPGAPTGEVTRVITNLDDEVMYLGTASYRGDLVVFNTSIDVPRHNIE